MNEIKELENTIKYLKEQFRQAAKAETPYDVVNGSERWSQADYTPGMDQLANEIGIAEDQLKNLRFKASREAAAQQRRSEIEMLKAQWLVNPIWDLEYTEGFEDARQELYAWKVEQIQQSKADWFKKITDKAFQLNCSYSLADYILNLEDRIKGLERRINNE